LRKKKKQHGVFLKGFTLIELIIVIIVISILVRMAVPRYNRAVEKSRIAEAITILKIIHASQMSYSVEHDAYGDDFAVLDIGAPQARFFTFTALSGTPNPTSNSNETLSIAVRNSEAAGVYAAGYTIGITETGETFSPTPGGPTNP
jgi:prepilin-type N-terminal cleavage/methylation domain-containing protein